LTEPSDPEAPSPPAPEPSPDGPARSNPAHPYLGLTTFTIEGRKAPALFVVGWLATLVGVALTATVAFGVSGLGGSVLSLASLFALSVGLVMLANGDDPSVVTDSTFGKAVERIEKAVGSGQIRRFTGNDYAQPLPQGDLAAAVAWSGDVVQLLSSNPKLRWGIPESGAMLWTDNMLVPLGGSAATASTFMNFVYDPKIAAQIAAYVNYVTPVKGAREELAKTDPETAGNPLIFPTDQMLKQLHAFSGDALNNQEYIETWQRVLGA